MSEKTRIPLYPLSWGWNANGRCGNLTDNEIVIPGHVQHSKGTTYVAAAAGKHHSVLISEAGIMYSVGENYKGQLGYGNMFLEDISKAKSLQCYPTQVTPSGACTFGRDVRISQVGCGSYFTIGRERSLEEGIDGVRGLRKLEKAMKKISEIYQTCSVVQMAWAIVRHERFVVGRTSQGALVAWGNNNFGQLGVGDFVKNVRYPVFIKQLKNIHIVQVAVGQEHVLARTQEGHLYTWGRGRGGRLGHLDFETRYVPEKVRFFDTMYVDYVAAGVAHSAVLVTNRKGLPRNEQMKRVVTFGRGAHGRLGNGKNRNYCSPVVVSKWPPSAQGLMWKQVSCGGAHTMVLGTKKAKKGKTLANPWGIVSLIYSFGFGMNGQLGTGYCYHTFIPVKTRVPKWEIFVEVSAGKSWSLARTLAGDLYTWGKGMRGQLGQGRKTRFCLQPEKIPNVMPMLKMSSGYTHNICISVPRKYLNKNTTLEAVGSKSVLDHEFVYSGLRQRDAVCAFTMSCCKRPMHPGRTRLRYYCVDCKLASICYNCAKQCHSRHEMYIRNDSTGQDRTTEKLVPPFCFGTRTRYKAYKPSILFNAMPQDGLSTEKISYGELKTDHDEEEEEASPKHREKKSVYAYSTVVKAHHKEEAAKGQKTKVTRHAFVSGAVAPPTTHTNHLVWLPFAIHHHRKVVINEHENKVLQNKIKIYNDAAMKKYYKDQKKRPNAKNKVPLSAFLKEYVPIPLPERPHVPVPFCECSVFRSDPGHFHTCHVLPTVDQVDEEKFVKMGDRLPVTNRHLCARIIQRAMRKCIADSIARKIEEESHKVRKVVCQHHWENHILSAIWMKVQNAQAEYREDRERVDMAIEDDIKHKYDYYLNLQTSLAAMDAMMFGVRELVANASIAVYPTGLPVIPHEDRQNRVRGHSSHAPRAQDRYTTGPTVKKGTGVTGGFTIAKPTNAPAKTFGTANFVTVKKEEAPVITTTIPVAKPKNMGLKLSLNAELSAIRDSDEDEESDDDFAPVVLGKMPSLEGSSAVNTARAPMMGSRQPSFLGNSGRFDPRTPPPLSRVNSSAEIKPALSRSNSIKPSTSSGGIKPSTSSGGIKPSTSGSGSRSKSRGLMPGRMTRQNSASNQLGTNPLNSARSRQRTALPPEPHVDLRRTFAFSYHSIRELQMEVPLVKYKVPQEDIVRRARYFPIFDRHEGVMYDPDMSLFTARFIKDAATERWRAEETARIAAKEAAAQAIIDAKRQLARQAIIDKKNLIAKAAALGAPPAPKGPPPKASVEAFKLKREQEKAAARAKVEEDYVAKVRAEEKQFDQFDGPKRPKTMVQRRNTITVADTGLYFRVREIKPALQLKCYATRRNSLPFDILDRFHPSEKPLWSYAAAITESLSEFNRRHQILIEFIDTETYGEILWANITAYQKRCRLKKVLGLAWSTPSFPSEIVQKYSSGTQPVRQMEADDASVEGGSVGVSVEEDGNMADYFDEMNAFTRARRYSIGEPERLYRQFAISRDMRKSVQRLRGRLRRRHNMPLRRRSFDLNEFTEKSSGVADALRLDFDEPAKPLTAFGFRRDSEDIDRKMQTFTHWGEQHQAEEDMIAREKYLSRTYEIEELNYVSKDPLGSRTDDVALNQARYQAQEWDGTVGGWDGGTWEGTGATVWQEHFSDEGHQYYYCVATGESAWEYPSGEFDQVLQQCQDETSGNWYWFNTVTGESEWM